MHKKNKQTNKDTEMGNNFTSLNTDLKDVSFFLLYIPGCYQLLMCLHHFLLQNLL